MCDARTRQEVDGSTNWYQQQQVWYKRGDHQRSLLNVGQQLLVSDFDLVFDFG